MDQTLAMAKNGRAMLLQLINTSSLESINKIPFGFKNNICWNIGHIIVVQQQLVYKLSGLPMLISGEFVEKYKRGTIPGFDITEADFEEMKSLFSTTIQKTNEDYKTGIFQVYQQYKTQLGAELKTVDDAITFNNFHEGLHIGMIFSLLKLV